MAQQLPLRDIHVPEAVSWWPPAVGWWLLLVIIPVLCYVLWWGFKKISRRTAIKRAKKMLAVIENAEQCDNLHKLQQISMLLRRVAISVAPRRDCAALTGRDWLRYLDRSVEGTPFSEGVGRCLSDAQYRRTAPDDIDLPGLFRLCETWLKRQKS